MDFDRIDKIKDIETIAKGTGVLLWTPKFGQCVKLHLGVKKRRTKWKI
jgi:hypothetical protein